jgi:hypothetical protein
MKKLLLGLLVTFAGASFAETQSNCELDTYFRLYPRIFSGTVKAERSDINAIECLFEASVLSAKNETVKGRIYDPELNIRGKFVIRTNNVLPALTEACRIDTYLELEPRILSSWVKIERSDLNTFECLLKALELAEKNDKINIMINDDKLNLKGSFKIRK